MLLAAVEREAEGQVLGALFTLQYYDIWFCL
jgi:hypothetical protein